MSDKLRTLHAVAEACLSLAARAGEGPGREALLDMADRTLAQAVLIDAGCAPARAAEADVPAMSEGVPAAPGKD